jgi:hypothetical protein
MEKKTVNSLERSTKKGTREMIATLFLFLLLVIVILYALHHALEDHWK